MSRFRDDVRLKYLYTGPKTGQRGRPKKFIGDVNLKKLDMSIFETFASGDIAIYSAIVWAVSLKLRSQGRHRRLQRAGQKGSVQKSIFLDRHIKIGY